MITAIAGGALALGSAALGAIKSANAAYNAKSMLAQQEKDNKAWYETKMASDYTQRADVQNAIRKQRELLNEQYKRAKATNVVSGGTDAGLAMQKEAANNALGNTMGDIAAASAAYKDNVENQFRAEDRRIKDEQRRIEMQKAAAIAQAAGQGVNAGLSMMGGNLGK